MFSSFRGMKRRKSVGGCSWGIFSEHTNWEIIFLYHCFYIHDESQSLFHIDNLNTVELELL